MMAHAVSVSAAVAECPDCDVHRQPHLDGGIHTITVTLCENHRV